MKKIKVEWLAAALVVLVMGAVLVFLLISTLTSGGREPAIQLPDGAGSENESDVQQRPREPVGEMLPATLTKGNVQDVVATLHRPESYYIQVESIVSYRESSRVMTAEQWLLPDRCVTRTQDSLTNRVLYTLTEAGESVLWYGDDSRVLRGGSDSFGEADVLAGIPTYEDILALPADVITAADYRDWNEMSCIYVETYDETLAYNQRYYISVESGMLVHAETYTGGELVYSMNLLSLSEDAAFGETIAPPA